MNSNLGISNILSLSKILRSHLNYLSSFLSYHFCCYKSLQSWAIYWVNRLVTLLTWYNLELTDWVRYSTYYTWVCKYLLYCGTWTPTHKLSHELLQFVGLYSRDIVSRNVLTSTFHHRLDPWADQARTTWSTGLRDIWIVTSSVNRSNEVTFPWILNEISQMNFSHNFSLVETIIGHTTANSWKRQI